MTTHPHVTKAAMLLCVCMPGCKRLHGSAMLRPIRLLGDASTRNATTLWRWSKSDLIGLTGKPEARRSARAIAVALATLGTSTAKLRTKNCPHSSQPGSIFPRASALSGCSDVWISQLRRGQRPKIESALCKLATFGSTSPTIGTCGDDPQFRVPSPRTMATLRKVDHVVLIAWNESERTKNARFGQKFPSPTLWIG